MTQAKSRSYFHPKRTKNVYCRKTSRDMKKKKDLEAHLTSHFSFEWLFHVVSNLILVETCSFWMSLPTLASRLIFKLMQLLAATAS